MKKFVTSAIFVLAFGVYIIYQNVASANTVSTSAQGSAVAVTTPTPTTPAPTNSNTQPQTTSAPPAPTPTQQTPAPTPAPAQQKLGPYTDGTYTGSVTDAYYGYVQVQVTIKNGQIASVAVPRYPTAHSTSRYINSQALPMLKQETLQAQNANVNIISGATATSVAFRQSLSSALARAKA